MVNNNRKRHSMPPGSHTSNISKPFFYIILIAFFFSGITGLIYELLWTRMIEAITGTSPFSVSIVLTVFMGGLGFGSWVASKTIDKIKSPGKLLKLYGIIELVIGIYGIILPILLIFFRPLYALLYNHLFHMFMLYNLLTFVGCMFILIIPAVCMGATLPVLSRFYITHSSHIGSHLGQLYGINTIGAAVGSIFCGFWLIGTWGVYGALGVAILINAMIGILAIKLSQHKILSKPLTLSTKTEIPLHPDSMHLTPYGFKRDVGSSVLVIFAVSGFCSMSYEVIWTKLLGLIVGPTTYSFTIVIATFIFGLALGSIVFGALADRFANKYKSASSISLMLVITQIGAAVSALAVSQFLGNSQLFYSKLIDSLHNHFIWLNISKTVSLFMFIAIPTLFLGATFPLVGKIYIRSTRNIGKSVGFAYSINTIGAVLGSFCAGFILIPFLGKEQSITLLVMMQLTTITIAGGYVLINSSTKHSVLLPLAIIIISAMGTSFVYPRWNHKMLSVGKYHRSEGLNLHTLSWFDALFNWKEWYQDNENEELVFYGDGIGGFTTVLKNIGYWGEEQYSIQNSGKAEASSRNEDMMTQTLVTHFPMIFHRNPKSVMVLGLASGITAGEALLYPIEQLDIIDINEQVVDASKFFIPWNNNVLEDPRTNLIIQDGRAHIQMTNNRYDIIISEPSNPWMAGLAALFTKEFFSAVRNKLNDDGIFCQWIHSYQNDWENFSLIGRTFASEFPQSVLVSLQPSGTGPDYLLIGFKNNRSLDPEILIHNYSYAKRSTNMTLPDPHVFYGLIFADNLIDLFGDGPINSDYKPLLEYNAPKQLYTYDITIDRNLLSRRRLSSDIIDQLQPFVNDVSRQLDILEYLLSFNRELTGLVSIDSATPEQKKRYKNIMLDYCEKAWITDFSFIENMDIREECFMHHIDVMREFAPSAPKPEYFYQHIGSLFDNRGEIDIALSYYNQAIQANPDFDTPYFTIGRIHELKKDYVDAEHYYQKAIDINPRNASAHNNIGTIYSRQNKSNEALSHYRESLRIDPNQPIIHLYMAEVLKTQGKIKESEKHVNMANKLQLQNK